MIEGKVVKNENPINDCISQLVKQNYPLVFVKLAQFIYLFMMNPCLYCNHLCAFRRQTLLPVRMLTFTFHICDVSGPG